MAKSIFVAHESDTLIQNSLFLLEKNCVFRNKKDINAQAYIVTRTGHGCVYYVKFPGVYYEKFPEGGSNIKATRNRTVFTKFL